MSDSILCLDRFKIANQQNFQTYYVFYQKKLDYARSKLMSLLDQPFMYSLHDSPKNTRFSIVGFIHIDNNERFPHINFTNQTFRNGRQVFLEDSSGRARLIGEFPFPITSNICVGVSGVLTIEGNLLFDRIMTLPKLSITNKISHPPLKIAFVSNICLDSPDFDIIYGQKLIKLLNTCDLCIIIGNIFQQDEFSAFIDAEMDWKEWVEIIDPSLIEKFNILFSDIEKRCIFIPGFGDPTNAIIPIQPFHESFIKHPDMECTTNPALINIQGMQTLVMTGNFIDQIDCEGLSFHEKQKQILSWRNIVPCAPSKIPCEVCEKDILTLDFMPQLFVAGGSDTLEATMVDNTLVISIPDYISHRQAIVFNAGDNEISLIDLIK